MNLPTHRVDSALLGRKRKLHANLLGMVPSDWIRQWQLHSDSFHQRWLALAPRERRGLRWTGWGLTTILLFTLGVMPAWRTLQEAPVKLSLVESQLQQMNQLASEARLLRATPFVSMAKSMDALTAASDRLGAVAKLNFQGQQATVTLNGVTPEALTEWLREIRTVGRVRVTEANLTRAGTSYSGSVLIALGGVTP